MIEWIIMMTQLGSLSREKKRAKQVELVLKIPSLFQNILVQFHSKTTSTPPTLGKPHQQSRGRHLVAIESTAGSDGLFCKLLRVTLFQVCAELLERRESRNSPCNFLLRCQVRPDSTNGGVASGDGSNQSSGLTAALPGPHSRGRGQHGSSWGSALWAPDPDLPRVKPVRVGLTLVLKVCVHYHHLEGTRAQLGMKANLCRWVSFPGETEAVSWGNVFWEPR